MANFIESVQQAKAKLLLLVGTSSSKILPVLFGAYLSRELGSNIYTAYILLLSYCALLSSPASMGTNPQILRSAAESNQKKTIEESVALGFLIALISIIVSTGTWIYRRQDPLGLEGYEYSHLAIILYTFAIFIIISASSILNQKREWALSGVCQFGVYLLPILSVAAFSRVIEEYKHLIPLYGASFFVAALILMAVVGSRYRLFFTGGLLSCVSGYRSFIKRLAKNLNCGVFGLVTLGGFYLLNVIVKNGAGSDAAALFGASFQFFAITIYLPSTLGSVLVPVLSAKKSDSREYANDLRLALLGYSISSAICAAVFSYFDGEILAIYGLEAKSGNNVFQLMQFAAFLASLNAFFVQLNVARGNFGTLNALSVLWISVIAFFVLKNPISPASAAYSLIISYIVVLLFYITSLSFKYFKSAASS